MAPEFSLAQDSVLPKVSETQEKSVAPARCVAGHCELGRMLSVLQQIASELSSAEHDYCVIFADLVGSSRYKIDHGVSQGVLRAHLHNTLVQQCLSATPIVVKHLGDGLLVLVGSDGASALVHDLCSFLVSLPEKRTEFLAIGEGLESKVAVHYGPAVVCEIDGHKDALGPGVDTAARIVEMANPGGLYVSGVFLRLLENAPSAPHLSRSDSRTLAVPGKDVAELVEVFEVYSPGKVGKGFKTAGGEGHAEDATARSPDVGGTPLRSSRAYASLAAITLGLLLLWALFPSEYGRPGVGKPRGELLSVSSLGPSAQNRVMVRGRVQEDARLASLWWIGVRSKDKILVAAELQPSVFAGNEFKFSITPPPLGADRAAVLLEECASKEEGCTITAPVTLSATQLPSNVKVCSEKILE